MKTLHNQIPFKLTLSLFILALCFTGCIKRPLLLRNRPNVPPPSLDPSSDEVPASFTGVVVGAPVVMIDVEEDFTPPVVTEVKSVPLTHTVKKGDSFWKIARMYGVTNVELAACNNVSLAKPLKIGTVLVIPPGGVANYQPKATPKTSTTKVTKPAPKARPATNNDGTYTVKRGDSLWKISRRYKITTQALIDANGINRQRPIIPGMKLIIPGGRSPKVQHKPKPVNKKPKVIKTVPVDDKKTEVIEIDPIDDILQDAENAAGDKNPTDAGNAADVISGLDSAVAAADKPLADDLYTEEVLPNETLQEIAERHGLKVEDLLKANPGLKANQKLKPFTSIKIPNKQY